MIQDYYSSYLFLHEKGEKDVSIGNSEQTPKWNNTFNSIKYHQRYNTILSFLNSFLSASLRSHVRPSVGRSVGRSRKQFKCAKRPILTSFFIPFTLMPSLVQLLIHKDVHSLSLFFLALSALLMIDLLLFFLVNCF